MSIAEVGQWETILDYLRTSLSEKQFQTWFTHIQLVDFQGDRIIVAVPNSFYKEWIEKYYRHIIVAAAQLRLNKTVEVEVQVDSSAFPDGTREVPVEAPTSAEPSLSMEYGLSPELTFGSFVVGPSNRLCHAACVAICEAPGRTYNPFFMHGSVGLGKTHLMQAICHTLLERNPGTRILYLSCESFVNHFIQAVTAGNIEAFRNKYRYVDVLLIDDIHFLADKERTQEEFFHTFNALYNANKQIILSSDSPPQDIPSLEERLVSRFKWGLVASLEPPHFETRMAIVRKKAEYRNIQLPDDVVEFVATYIDTNIRELEGAIIRLGGYSKLAGQPITLQLAREVLKEYVSLSHNISVEDILSSVCSHFHVRVADLQSRKRSKSIAFPRQICMHLCRKLTNRSLEELGGYFGGRDHTTVMYADDKIAKLIETDDELRLLLDNIVTDLRRKK